MKRYYILLALFIGAVYYAQAKEPPRKDKRPNIILIMADDMGYSDLGCYGGEIQTPNVDNIARSGIRFTQFYNISRCCPTRASLLTGLYNHDAGIGQMTGKRDDKAYKGHIGKDAVTIAEVLKTAGYRTAMSGKWHVSNTITRPTPEEQLKWLSHQVQYPLFSPIDQYPTSRGFEKFYGTIWGVIDFFDPFSLVEGTTPITPVPEGYYHTDAINDKAVEYIKEFAQGEQPFFLYVAHNAPHWPLHALPEDIEKYKDTYTKGWDAIREQRYQRMIKMGIIDPQVTKLSLRHPGEMRWEDNPHKEWDARAMAVHAAMIDRMDQGIGRIIQALKETGQYENTILIFLSDNGASPELCERYGPGFDRPGSTRAGMPIAYNTDKSVLPGPQTTFFSIGPDWANVANTPYRMWKAQSAEGGIRTPMIISWPAVIKNKGAINHQLVGHVMDFMPTLIEVAEAQYPEEYNGHKIQPLAGKSFAAVLKGGSQSGHQTLFNEHEGARYVRHKGWKLVLLKGQKEWSLYDIINDPAEINDLAAQHPDKVKELEAMWNKWAREHHVLPKPNNK